MNDGHFTPDHLQVETSNRGFKRMPPIPGDPGGWISVYESSVAFGPHIWLRVVALEDLNRPDGPKVQAIVHLAADDAQRLSEQLAYLVRHHYQSEAR